MARSQRKTDTRITEKTSRRVVLIGLSAVVGLAIVVWAVWQGFASRPRCQAQGFSILLVTLDTTRADFLGCYGHPGSHTPNIDRLAAEGTMFTQCTASAPATLPSHASIMTAMHPYVHGARDNVGYRLVDQNTTLAESLRTSDYRTGAFVSAFVVNRQTGLDQGFDKYGDAGSRPERRGNEVCGEAIQWLRGCDKEKFFLWVHFFDPHYPYEPPEPHRTRYRDAYQGEIAFVDQEVGRLLDALRSFGLEDRTLVVLTADHGEGLGQHDEPTHLFFLYDTTLSVPLLFWAPSQIPAGRRVDAQIRTIDIAPTILDMVGTQPLPMAQGTSLRPLILGETDDLQLAAYAETIGGQRLLGTSMLRCLRSDGWKYIHAPRPELFDLSRDPGERFNIAAAQPSRVAAFRECLRELIVDAPTTVGLDDARVDLDAEALDRLESLGYTGRAVDLDSTPVDELDLFEPTGDDPKDHAEDFVKTSQAERFLKIGQNQQAEAIFGELVTDFPEVIHLREKLARSIFFQGRLDESIAIYEELVESHPARADLRCGLGKLLDHAGRHEEAIAQFAAAVAIDPESPKMHYDLGIALRAGGRHSEALDCFRQALRIKPTYLRAQVNLATELSALGRYSEAVEYLGAAVQKAPGDAFIHFKLGEALLGADRREEAVRSFKESLRLNPHDTAVRNVLEQLR